MSAPVIANLTVTCDECGRTVTIPDSYIEMWYASSASKDFGVERLVLSCLRPEGWVLLDEAGRDVRVCPDCVERTKVDRARRECPTWCTTDHSAEEPTGEWTFFHVMEGDIIGTYSPAEKIAVYAHQLEAEVSFDDIAGRAEIAKDLRELARNAITAAEWLEGGGR